MVVMPVVMIVIMAVAVAVVVIMAMAVTMMMMIHIQPAGPGAEMVAQVAILDIASRHRDALTLDVMVVALLRLPDLVLEPQNLRPVFAHGAVHVVVAFQNFTHPVGEGGDHLGMVVQIAGLDKLDIRMRRRNLVGEAVDAVDQDTAEKEIGENDDALEAKARHMLKAWLDQREGHAGISDLGPAEAHAFPQHAGNLRDVGVGVRIGSAAPDHDKTGIRAVDGAVFLVGHLDGGGDPVTGRLQHLQIDRKLAAILDGDAVLCRIGVQH